MILKHILRQNDVSSFLSPNFIVVSLGFTSDECLEENYPLVKSTNLTNNLQ